MGEDEEEEDEEGEEGETEEKDIEVNIVRTSTSEHLLTHFTHHKKQTLATISIM